MDFSALGVQGGFFLRVQGFITFIGAVILPPVFSARMGISEATYLPLFFVVGQFWGLGGLFRVKIIAYVILIARSLFFGGTTTPPIGCFVTCEKYFVCGLFFLDFIFLETYYRYILEKEGFRWL